MKYSPISSWVKGNKSLPLIAGPCSAESEKQVMDTGRQLAAFFPNSIFRAGLWKARTSPGSFEGVGKKGLIWLKNLKQETGLPLATEVANPKQVEACLKYGIDVLWIGARTTVNPFYVQEIAEALKGCDVQVLVKNPVNPELKLWMGAIERVSKSGIKEIAAVHRGFHSLVNAPYRNQPHWELFIDLKMQMPGLPVFCDPSHIGGKRNLIAEISQKALDLSADGLMIESHVNPSMALSDAEQQLTPLDLSALIAALEIRYPESGKAIFDQQLDLLREKINRADEELLRSLANRMETVRQIGEKKKEEAVTILQIERWKEIISSRLHSGNHMGLHPEFVHRLYLLIHEEAIRLQAEIMNQKEKEV